jgi:hypothetical protein
MQGILQFSISKVKIEELNTLCIFIAPFVLWYGVLELITFYIQEMCDEICNSH